MYVTAHGFKDKVANIAINHFIAKEGSDSSLEYKTVLILVGMAMQGSSQGMRRHRMLNEGEATSRLFARYHKTYTHRGEKTRISIAGT